MNTRLFWFSGTGNSLAIARDLAAALGNAELIPMAHALGSRIPVAEKTGFVFPVYAFGLPGIVSEFLRKVPVNPNAYYFTVANCAGTAGAPHRQARRILSSRGGRLAAGWTLFMPGNYPILANPPPEDQQRRCFDTMKARLPDIAETIRRAQPGSLEDSFLLFRGISPWINFMAIKQFRRADKKFRVEPACQQCGLCAKICPVDNIRLVDKRPTWLHRCEQCMACLQWCPAQAIQYGQVTQTRKRYHHPGVKALDLCPHDNPRL